jgi:hypothetical protein
MGIERDTNVLRSAEDLAQSSYLFQRESCSTTAQYEQPRSQSSLLRRAVKSEFTISVNADTIPIAKASAIVDPGAWSVILQSIASLFGILQIIFGTLVFSSLLYIGVEDATILLLKYATSAFCCRLIMYLEVEGMIRVVRENEEKSCSNGN